MALTLVTAGESHGPALVAVVTGLPAGLVLDKAAIDADLRRRQEGYGRSPRQRIEQDEVEVLAGLRHGRTLGTPLALVVRNRDHENWEWGMTPWPPTGEPSGKGTKEVTLPRPGHADLAGLLKYGLADVRDALERASARHTAAIVAAAAVAKALLAVIDVEVEGHVLTDELERRVEEARRPAEQGAGDAPVPVRDEVDAERARGHELTSGAALTSCSARSVAADGGQRHDRCRGWQAGPDQRLR